MTQLSERTRRDLRPAPDEAVLSAPQTRGGGMSTSLRILGALAVLAVGAVHLEQYFGVHFRVVPVIGTLFLLNFVAATLIGVGLLVPGAGMRLVHVLLALGGIGLAATSFVFLFISEHQPLFGFQDYGYRTAIVIALAAEAAAVLFLGSYLAVRPGRR